jgi:glycosyltransferase involved in cell wall biosynthesis
VSHKILYVISSLDVGGTEMQLVLLARQIATTTFVPHVLCTRREGELAESLRKAGVEVECLETEKPISLKTCQRIKWYCRDWEIDLVHTFLFGMDLGAVRGARSAGVRAVVTSRRQIPDWKKGRHLRVQRMANKKTDLVVCNSNAVRDYICKQESLPESKTRVVYNGFPEGSIPPEPLLGARPLKREALRSFMIQEDELTLCCIANFSPVKNHKVLLDAFRKVLLKGIKIRLFLIGDGPLRSRAERYAEERNLGMATEFLGQRLDRLKILAECDALVLPSLNEGFPNAVLEAQALGVPVVASNVGGIPELVEHGETGWLFDPNEANSIAGAIWTVLLQREDALRVATAAQARVRSKFTATNMVANYHGLYEELLRG